MQDINICKAVIVLDCLPIFFESSKQQIDFDMHTKPKGPLIHPIPPITKTMWTCAIEGALEYARIIYDIFPNEKLIQIVINGKNTSSINSWNLGEQNFQFLNNALANFPHLSNFPTTSTFSVEQYFTNGCQKAVELLSQPTKKQKENHCFDNAIDSNHGHIIYLTSLKNCEEANWLGLTAGEIVSVQNKISECNKTSLQISACRLTFIDMHPINACINLTGFDFKEISPLISCELHISQSGKILALKMVELAMKHYRLSSTTVTGIPMKEEQNAQSSANYDVELLHDENVYIDLIKMGYLEELSTPSKELLISQTILLKWCTPKTVSAEMHQCSSAFRITPVDVISRPSSCLINFLLGGRSVMLEQHRKSGSKVTSHMLTSHGGEVFIHTLSSANCKRSPLEDPLSISEGPGGKITDYRISDFGELMQSNLLAPYGTLADNQVPLKAAMDRLEQTTKYWPMLISETTIFNITNITEPILRIMLKPEITASDVLECSRVIHHLVTMETRHEPLTTQSNASGRVKSNKRDTQYRQMWSELEKFIRCHSDVSPGHEKVLQCLLENGRAAVTEEERAKKPMEENVEVAEEKVEVKLDARGEARKRKVKEVGTNRLTDVWLDLLNSRESKSKQEFHGRLQSIDNKYELYKHLKTASDD